MACASAVGGPTPTYEALREIPDLELVPVDLGPELGGRPARQGARLVATAPAVWTLLRLVLLVRRRGIQIIHTSDRPRDAFVAVLIARLTGARAIVHVHVAYNPAWMGRMLRWSLAHADALVAVSSFVGRHAGRRADMHAERVHVVLQRHRRRRRGSPAWAGTTVRRELGIADDAPVVVTVCRLFPEKGPAELIRAIAGVARRVADVVLLVVGGVAPGTGVRRRARRTRPRSSACGRHVRFLGRRPDVAAVMAAADVFAMPSHEEPFGLVFVEAMAMEPTGRRARRRRDGRGRRARRDRPAVDVAATTTSWRRT